MAAAKPAAAITETPSRYQSALQQADTAAVEPLVQAPTEPAQPVVTPRAAEAQTNPLSDDSKLAAEVDRWAAMIDNLDLTGLSRQIAGNAVLQKQHDGSYQLLLRASLSNLLSDSVVEHLQQQLQHGYDLQLTAVVVADSSDATPYEIQQQIDQRRLARAQQVLADDPTVKAVTATFAAELVDDSVKPL